MGTVTTNTNSYSPVKSLYVESPCGVTGKVLMQVSGYVRKTILTRESRPKPDLLLENLTSRGTQTLMTTRYLFQRKLETVNVVCGGVTYQRYRVSENYAAPGGNYPDTPVVDWATALRTKIKSDSLSFAEMIGEYREAIRYVEDGSGLLKRAWNTARYLWRNRRHRRRIIRRLLKTGLLGEKASGVSKFQFYDIVGADLALKFGVVPLMELASDALSKLGTNMGRARRFQVTLSKEVTERTAGAHSGYSTVRIKDSKRAVAYVWFNNSYGDYTPGNILESLWAGARLTFMVDWFLNVGRYLSALDAMSTVEKVRGTVTTRRFIWVDDGRIANAGWNLVSRGKLRISHTWRETMTSVPMPLLPRFELPEGDLGKILSSCEVLLSIRRAMRH